MTFLFELANFAVLAGVLVWLFFKPVRATIEGRQAALKGEAERAAADRAEAERIREEIDARRRGLAAELEQLRVQARVTADQQAAELIAVARAEADRQRLALGRELEAARLVQATPLALAVAAAVRESVASLLTRIQGPDLDRALIQAALRELGAQVSQQRSLGLLTVESAQPLDDEVRGELERTLGSTSSESPPRIEYHQIPELVGGLRLISDAGLVDASVTGLAAFAERSLRDRLMQSNHSGGLANHVALNAPPSSSQ